MGGMQKQFYTTWLGRQRVVLLNIILKEKLGLPGEHTATYDML